MASPSRYTRQPIVSVLGHVDHGKTSFLDFIRGTAVVSREAGAITQHIGATEVPIDAIYNVCGELLKSKKFSLPGLLFIDTPGHHAFTTLRARGGSLADLAVLIVDINEGFKPQSYESLNILKQYRTPFIVAANKIDSISGWQKTKGVAKTRINSQRPNVKNDFEEKNYELIGTIFENKLKADLYYNIADFRKTIGIVPISAKTGEGIPELLMVLVGLAQRFLEDKLHIESGPGKGSVLEVKEEIGMGKTIDAIIYAGTVKSNDKIVIGTIDQPITTTIRALLKPKPLDEIRDPRERFDSVKEVHAACGIKISSPDLEGVIPGAPIRVATDNIEEVIEVINKKMTVLGNLDSINILEKGSKQDLKAAIRTQVKKGRRNGSRFIMSIGSPVTPDTPLSRVKEYLDIIREIQN